MLKIKNLARAILCAIFIAALSACGGGGGARVVPIEIPPIVLGPIDLGPIQVGQSEVEISPAQNQAGLSILNDLMAGVNLRGAFLSTPIGQINSVSQIRTVNGRIGLETRNQFANLVYFGRWRARDQLDSSAACTVPTDCWNAISGFLGPRESPALRPTSGTATYNLFGNGLYDPPGNGVGLSQLPFMGGTLRADFAAGTISGELTDEQTNGWRISLTQSGGFARDSNGRDFSGTATITGTSAAGAAFLNQSLTLTGGFAGGDDWVFGEGQTASGTKNFDYAFVGRQQ